MNTKDLREEFKEWIKLPATEDEQNKGNLDLYADWWLSHLTAQIEEEIEWAEKKYGKFGTFSGSLGYQGIVQGITSLQMEQDKIRDDLITHLKEKLLSIKK